MAIDLVSAFLQIGAGFLLNAVGGRTPVGPRLDEANLKPKSSSYGADVGRLIAGSDRMAGNIIWAEKIKEKKHKSGGFFSPKTVRYTYTGTFAVGICEGPIDQISRIWAGPNLIFDSSPPANSTLVSDPSSGGVRTTLSGNGQIVTELSEIMRFYEQQGQIQPDGTLITNGTGTSSSSIGGSIRKYLGTEDQTIDPALLADLGADASAFRGLVYVVFQDIDLTEYGNTFPTITVEVTHSPVPIIPTFDSIIQTGTLSLFVDLDKDLVMTQRDDDIRVFQTSDELPRLVTRQQTTNSVYMPVSRLSDRVYYITGGQLTQSAYAFSLTTGDVVDRSIDVDVPNSDRIPTLPIPYAMETIMFNGREYAVIVGDSANTLITLNTPGLQLVNRQTLLTVNDPGYDLARNFSDPTVLFGAPVSASADPDHLQAGPPDTMLPPILSTQEANLSYVADYSMLITRTSMASYGVTNNVSVRSMSHCEYDNTLLVQYEDNTIIKIQDSAPFTQIASITNAPYDVSRQSRITSQYFYAFGTSTLIYRVDADTLLPVASDDYGLGGLEIRGFVYDGLSNSAITTLTTLTTAEATIGRRIFFDRRVVADGDSLASAVTRICEAAGFSANDIEVSDLLTTVVRGYSVTSGTLRSWLDPLSQGYLMDMAEVDGKLRFTLRGKPSTVSIPFDEIGDTGDLKEGGRLQTTQLQDIEVPRVVNIKYKDRDRDYQAGAQQSQRITSPRKALNSNKTHSVDLPLVLSPDDAKSLSARWLFSFANERRARATKLPWRYMYLDPTDVITIETPSENVVARMTSVDTGSNFTVDMTAVQQDNASLSITATGADLTAQGDVILPTFPSVLFHIDTPFISDDDFNATQLGYVMVSGFDPWSGGRVMDDVSVLSGSDTAAMWGYTSAVLNPSQWTTWDDVTTITVAPISGTPTSSTDELVLEGANTIALLGPLHELVQFVNATDNMDGSYTLSRLLRGRRGTDYAAGIPHLEATRFIQITDDRGSAVELETDYRAVSSGSTISTTPATPFTFTGAPQKPLSPVDLTASQAAGLVTMQWKRRSRIGGEMDNNVEIPLGEAVEAYEVEVFDGATKISPSIDSGTETLALDAGQSLTYFGSTFPITRTIKVYQIGDYGRGFVREETLEIT